MQVVGGQLFVHAAAPTIGGRIAPIFPPPRRYRIDKFGVRVTPEAKPTMPVRLCRFL